MKNNISPEEKLLKLIKRDNGRTVENGRKKSDLNTMSLNGSGLVIMRRFLRPDARKIIILAFFISSLYFASTIISPYIAFRKVGLSAAKEQAPRGVNPKGEVKPFESYLEGIRGKEIFKRSAIVQDAGQPLANLEENMLKDIVLIGVIADENPQAILENKKTQKTFYLRKDQMLEDFKVSDIKEGKVILEREGQMYELNL